MITAVTPNGGPTIGVTQLTLTGSGLDGVSSIAIDVVTAELTGVAVDVQDNISLQIAVRTTLGGLPTDTVLGEALLSGGSTSMAQVVSFPQTDPNRPGRSVRHCG